MDLDDDQYGTFDLNQSVFNNENRDELTEEIRAFDAKSNEVEINVGVFDLNQSLFDDVNLSADEVEVFYLNPSIFHNEELHEIIEENTQVKPNEDALSLLQLNYSSEDDNEEDIEQLHAIISDDTAPKNFMGLREDTTENFSTDLIFADRTKLVEWCRIMGKNIGVVVVTKHSESGTMGRKPRIILACERSGEYRQSHKRRDIGITGENSSSNPPRKTGTKKCGCPFRLRGIFCKESGWRVNVDCGFHNHVLGDNLVGHAYVARLTPEEQKLVTCMTLGGSKPREIECTLKKTYPENLSTRVTIYNFRARHKLLNLQGRSQMQQLFKDLNEHGYLEFHRENEKTGECMDIFLAHPQSIMLAKCFPEVIVMDCTYKTNLHKLPLFEIVGFTSTKKTFAIAFVYLESEKEDNYLWALQKLHEVLENKASSVGVMVTDC